jgi:HEPN domain-containing protein
MKQDEWLRYKRQADHTLDSARRDLKAGDFDWACFKSQQLAVKGYVRATREYVTGHSLMRLLIAVGTEVPGEMVDCGRELDKVYIPSRYPDVYDAGAPMDYYQASDAGRAVDCAARILAWLDAVAAEKSTGPG